MEFLGWFYRPITWSYYKPIRKRKNHKSDLHFKTTACWVELRNQDLFASHKLFIGKVAKNIK